MLNDNAFAQMNRLRTELEKVFGSDLKNYGCAQLHPKVNVWEDAESFLVEAEMPGINFEDIEILIVEGDQLSIKGERQTTEKSRRHGFEMNVPLANSRGRSNSLAV